MKSWRLYWDTIRYLRVQQVVYQVMNRLRSKPSLTVDKVPLVTSFLHVTPPDKPLCLHGQTFTFLNQSVTFPAEIDWNYGQNGKLWHYNLSYFDFLNQAGLEARQGVDLIRDFICRTADLKAGLEPYPISLRIINWVRFLSYHRLELPDIDAHLWAQVRLLEERLEYHLLGNHLLENGFALLTAALYFQNRSVYQKAVQLVRAQLTEQLFRDGGHYERSPMYHQILLDRLLDCCHILQFDTWHQDSDTDAFLRNQARRMLGWLENMTFEDGSVPLLNDAADGVAPTTAQLRAKADRLHIRPQVTDLTDSGFRRFRTPTYELVANVGSIGPAHQPGHAHADTLSFLLQVAGQPVLVDSGTSTYENNARRQWERSTAAHTTVQIDEADSSEVWGGFRVGRRAHVTLLEDHAGVLKARHDGYQDWGIWHERTWIAYPEQLTIIDTINDEQTATARFYLAPEQRPLAVEASQIRFGWGAIEWQNAQKIRQKTVQVARQFNRLLSALVIEVEFSKNLRTLITCRE
ncbi:alginate lyase family protein [Larkinella harenae]